LPRTRQFHKGQKIDTLNIKAQPAPLGTRIHSDKLLSQNVELFHDFAPLNAQIGSILAPISTLLHRENRPFAPSQVISSGEYALRACVGKHTDRFGLKRGSDPQKDTKKGRRKWPILVTQNANFGHFGLQVGSCTVGGRVIQPKAVRNVLNFMGIFGPILIIWPISPFWPNFGPDLDDAK
jgi:hypothetical protein